MENSTAVTVVKVFSVLTWIGAAFAILMGLGAIVVGPTMLAMFAGSNDMLGPMIGGLAVVFGVIMLVFGIAGIFVGRGLWQHKNWARIIVLVFAVLSVLSVFGGNFLGAIIGAIEIWLFGFDKTVKSLFQ